MTTNLTHYIKCACMALAAGMLVTGGPETGLVRPAAADLAVLDGLAAEYSIEALLLLEDPACPESIPKPGKGQTCESNAKAHCTQNENCKGKTIKCSTKGGHTKHCKCKSDGTGLENDPCPIADSSATFDEVTATEGRTTVR